MPTLFKRLKFYCACHKVEPLNNEQRKELGSIILDKWFSQKNKYPLRRMKIKEGDDEFEVIVYPKNFIATIDNAISEYYREHSPPKPPKKERKRIPIKQVPVYKKQFPKPNKRY